MTPLDRLCAAYLPIGSRVRSPLRGLSKRRRCGRRPRRIAPGYSRAQGTAERFGLLAGPGKPV